MRMLARLVVMWLIAVALPIQGVAAATMLHCGAMQAAHSAHSAQGHGHGHGHHASSMDGGHDHAAHAAQAKHGHAAGDKASCSACASCCSAAALPMMPLVVASQERSPTAAPAPTYVIVDFLTDGPERPPRSFLA